MSKPEALHEVLINGADWLYDNAIAPRRRTMREFALDEIVLPDGPRKGLRLRMETQPWLGLWFDEIDSGVWQRHVMTGCGQGGKSLGGYVIPTMYHLFECNEAVMCGVPDRNMAMDKWSNDIAPAIMASRYAGLVGSTGSGSRGGKVDSRIDFLNGARLRFLSAKGDDKARSGATARILTATEIDGYDEAGGGSREADPLTQMEARLNAYDLTKREYLECTTSIKTGRVWQLVTVVGSNSRIVCPCPTCGEWVTPEQEHFTGWEDAEDELEAEEKGRFHCPACGVAFDDDTRAAMNLDCRLIHGAQTIAKDGTISGEMPRTRTLGFRWSAFNDLLKSNAKLAGDSWRAARAEDEENARKAMVQFIWVRPYEPEANEGDSLEIAALVRRTAKPGKGIVPEWATHLVMGIDVGKYWLHYAVKAYGDQARGHLVAYNLHPVHGNFVGTEQGIRMALTELWNEVCSVAWESEGSSGPRTIQSILVDSGWPESRQAVYDFCATTGGIAMPCKGFGATQDLGSGRYTEPVKINDKVRFVGDRYHVGFDPKDRQWLVSIDVDHWKTWERGRLITDQIDGAWGPGAMTFYDAPPSEHASLARHLTAEEPFMEFEPGRGLVRVWKAIRRQNHFLDSCVYASVAGHIAGVRLMGQHGKSFSLKPKKVDLGKLYGGKD